MKIVVKLLIASLLAGTLLFIYSCKKNSTDTPEDPPLLGLGDEPLPYQNTSWMAKIPDTKYLYEFSIPGTHDAAADLHTSEQGTMKNFVICQDYYISNQMNIGVRWFDVRLHYSDGTLTAHHAQYYLHKNFNDLLTAGLDFLAQHPTETIIYMIKQEDSDASQDDFAEAVYKYLIGRSADLSKFYLGHDMPTLGMVRGKIVIVSRYGTNNANSNKRGMYVDWDKNTKGENVDNCDYPLWVQDHYSCVTVPYSEKINEIEQGITYANTANNNRLYINFTSCEKDLDHYLTTIAENINPPIENYLNAHPEWNTCGVIMLNFAGGADDSKKATTRSIVPEFVQVIINHNTFIQEVTIGTQTWLKNNLDVTAYRNGDPIPNINDDNVWTAATSGAYCDINNNAGNSKTFGRLYNGYVIEDSRGICPEGWHVPSADEWTTLMDYLGGTDVAGGKMKEAGFDHWVSPNTNATNSSGFTALPAGYRDALDGSFIPLGNFGQWWSTDGIYGVWSTSSGNGWLQKTDYLKGEGHSVRCIKDNP